jgi:hypothetical protein
MTADAHGNPFFDVTNLRNEWDAATTAFGRPELLVHDRLSALAEPLGQKRGEFRRHRNGDGRFVLDDIGRQHDGATILAYHVPSDLRGGSDAASRGVKEAHQRSEIIENVGEQLFEIFRLDETTAHIVFLQHRERRHGVNQSILASDIHCTAKQGEHTVDAGVGGTVNRALISGLSFANSMNEGRREDERA